MFKVFVPAVERQETLYFGIIYRYSSLFTISGRPMKTYKNEQTEKVPAWYIHKVCGYSNGWVTNGLCGFGVMSETTLCPEKRCHLIFLP